MDQRLKIIQEQRKLKGVKWKELAENLPISAEGLRIAFSRNSVDDTYLKVIEERLGITKPTNISKEETPQESARFEDLVAKKVLDQLLPKIIELNKKIDLIAETSTSVDIGLERIQERVDDTFKEVIKLK